MAHLGAESGLEYEQAKVRAIIGTIIITFLIVSSPRNSWMGFVFTLYLIISTIFLAHIHFRPARSKARILLGQIVDASAISSILYFGGEHAAIGYSLYLWMIIGNGCRFGIPYLLSSTIMCVIHFGFISLTVSYWQEQGNMLLAPWLAIFMVPFYLFKLLKRLEDTTTRLENLSRYDELTGLYNRRAFNEQANLEYERLQRTDKPFSLILLDIDHFKRINDTHGHLVGDLVLKFVAEIIKDSCRDEDFISRYGGEEFIILAPGQAQIEDVSLAERIRKQVEAMPIDIGDQTIYVTVSLGTASWDSDFASMDSWIQAADSALYKAKDEGRNRVLSYQHPGEL
ncbi:diguanylate cyclase [Pleionea sp. CnH1-48]|uniref:GGDEF domain-containing protein n=1 Tax=Pleionea sp. CnH1-48 TaxID=2954494 RepID=UPI00209698C2|nr:diguanylate cyclase [Pleionea sp. CnH1-48]MCO7227544.1 GGDEF domain-containing protein [Pleionea sp. CnH1-48]